MVACSGVPQQPFQPGRELPEAARLPRIRSGRESWEPDVTGETRGREKSSEGPSAPKPGCLPRDAFRSCVSAMRNTLPSPNAAERQHCARRKSWWPEGSRSPGFRHGAPELQGFSAHAVGGDPKIATLNGSFVPNIRCARPDTGRCCVGRGPSSRPNFRHAAARLRDAESMEPAGRSSRVGVALVSVARMDAWLFR
jgi:hypothetical protein